MALSLVAVTAETASADRASIKRLARTLRTAKSEKARISAAVALARLKDRRATPALIEGLADKKSSVRAISATALGHVGDDRALPRLRELLEDDDDMVRSRSESAIEKIENRGTEADKTAKAPKKSSALSRVRIDGQEAPLRTTIKPTLHVTVKTTADKSKGRAKKRVRARRATRMKELMLAEISDDAPITTEKELAARYGLQSFDIDASIVKLERRVSGGWVEVECEIRITVSDARGKMLSFLTGGAVIQVAKKTYKRSQLEEMRKDALENAVRNVYQDLVAYLGKRQST